jgi:hypothetical protein
MYAACWLFSVFMKAHIGPYPAPIYFSSNIHTVFLERQMLILLYTTNYIYFFQVVF